MPFAAILFLFSYAIQPKSYIGFSGWNMKHTHQTSTLWKMYARYARDMYRDSVWGCIFCIIVHISVIFLYNFLSLFYWQPRIKHTVVRIYFYRSIGTNCFYYRWFFVFVFVVFAFFSGLETSPNQNNYE